MLLMMVWTGPMMDWTESSSLQFLVLVCVGIVVSGHDATSQEKPFQACIPDHNYVKTKKCHVSIGSVSIHFQSLVLELSFKGNDFSHNWFSISMILSTWVKFNFSPPACGLSQ